MSDKCQAEDQGGWPCNATPVVWQAKEGTSFYELYGPMKFCFEHRINKFIWTQENASEYLEPIDEELALGYMLEELAAEAMEEYRQGKTISLRDIERKWQEEKGEGHGK